MNFAFSDDEYLKRLKQQTMIGQDFIEAAFRNWFEDTDDYQCPFHESLREELSDRTFRLFMEWTFQLDRSDLVNSEDLSEKFGEVIQCVGLSLARTDDERLNIQYPGLPRVGDQISFHNPQSEARNGEIIRRVLIEKEGEKELRIYARYLDNGEEWETCFELIG